MAAISRDHENIAKRRTEIDREVDELRRSINSTRTHGIFYYLLLVGLFLIGFFTGHATHNLVGAGIIVIGLALLAWREVTGFRARTAVLNNVLGEKLAEQRHVEERQKELEIEQ
jgi:hypothetical protein